MQTIINQSLSDMLDKLLEKALLEEPERIEGSRVRYKYLFIENMGHIYNIYVHYRNDTRIVDYPLIPTNKQKELINKIFEKWGNNNEG